MGAAALSEADKTRLAKAARHLAQARGMPLALARRLVWQAYQSKGMEIACALAPKDLQPIPRPLSQAAQEAFAEIRRRLRGARA
jgi:hypothetical protein